LIIFYCNSKISLHFCKDCKIFCEGVKGSGVVEQNLPLPLISTTAAAAKPNGLICHNDLVDYNGLVSRNNHINHIGFIDHKSLIGFAGHIGLDGFIGLVSCNCIIGLINLAALSNHWLIGLIGVIGFGLSSLVGHNNLVALIGYNGLVSFIGLGFIGFIGLGLVSLARLISRISLVNVGGFSGFSLISLVGPNYLIGLVVRCIIGLIDLSALLNHWPIGIISIFGFGLIALSASVVSSACWLIFLISLIGILTHQPFCKRLTAAIIKTTKIS
jgi:hypothetical protein